MKLSSSSPKFSTIFFYLLLWLGLWARMEPANAVSRTVYFTQSGRNLTTDGLGESVSGLCRITISNPSTQSQTFLLAVTANATQTAAGAATLTSGTCSSGGSGTFSCGTTTLAANGSSTFVFTYPAYPTRLGGTTTAQQIVSCSGSITANDSTNPGFLIATGALLSFTESGGIRTQNATGGTTSFTGQAIFTQLPIAINRGKPF